MQQVEQLQLMAFSDLHHYYIISFYQTLIKYAWLLQSLHCLSGRNLHVHATMGSYGVQCRETHTLYHDIHKQAHSYFME